MKTPLYHRSNGAVGDTMAVYRDRRLQLIFGVTLMAVIGVSIITPAFPLIRGQLGLSETQVGLLVTMFTVPGIVMSPLIGVLSDTYGRRTLTVSSLLLFGIAGTTIAFSTSFMTILALRFIQGAAAAGLSTLSMALIGDVFTGDERAAAMGYNGSVLSVGTATYPFIGGILATFGWYYPFYIFLVAIPIGIAILLFLDIDGPERPASFRTYLREVKDDISSRRLMLYLAASVMTFILLYGSYLTFFTQFLDYSFGASSFEIGVVLSCMSISTAIVSSQAGRLITRFGNDLPIIFGFGCYAVGLVVMWQMTALWQGVVAVFIYGIGQGANLPSLQHVIIEVISSDSRGAISALYSSTLRIGQSIGPVLMGVFFGLDGYALIFGVSVVLAVSMALAMVLGTKVRPLST